MARASTWSFLFVLLLPARWIPAVMLQDAPSAALTLQAICGGKIDSLHGPAIAQSTFPTHESDSDEVHSYVNLDKGGIAWPASGIVSPAQGTLSCWVKLPYNADEKSRKSCQLQLKDTGGGEWTLTLSEVKYVAPKRMDSPDVEDEGDAEVTDEPVAVLQCQADMLTYPGGPKAGIRVAGKLMEKGGWHHLVWSWRSVNHLFYLDGQPIGGGNGISRMAPISNPKAAFSLLKSAGCIGDLRLFNRALEPEEVKALAAAGEKQYLPAPTPLRLWADWAFSSGRTIVYADAGALPVARVEVACMDAGSNRVLKKATLTHFPAGLAEMLVPVTEPDYFPPGTYRFDGIAYDKDGKELARAQSAPWTAEKKDWPWLGSRAGLDGKIKILPPFTPIAVNGAVVSTAMRRHTVGRSGMFSSIVADGGELLNGPMTLHAVSSGKALDFTAGPGLGKIENKEDEADWSAVTATPEGHTLRVDAHMEYDGVTRFDLTLTPKGALTLESAEIRIPYRAEILKVAHSKQTSWWHFVEITRDAQGNYAAQKINWNMYAPKEPKRRPGVIYDTNDIADGDSKFAPFLHVGNYHRGLMWFVENDRNWVHDAQVPSMELVATPQEQCSLLHVITHQVTLTEPWQVRFYVLANPYKPLPKSWRTWEVANGTHPGNEVGKHSDFRFWWHWNEYADAFRPYPGLGEPGKKPDPNAEPAGGMHGLANKLTYDDWRDKFKGDALRHCPFINFGTPGGFPLFDLETMVLPYDWKLHNNRPMQDYMVYWLQRCVEDIGIRGVYIDETYVEPYSYNVLAGDAPYIRDDGTRAMGYRFMEGRTYFRRIKQMFAEHGIDYGLWLHTTNYKPPFFTFADISMDGEHPQIWVPEFYNYFDFYNPVMSRGYLSGQQYGYVATLMYHGNTDPRTAGPTGFAQRHFKSRSYLACTLPFSVLPQGTGAAGEFDRTQNIRYAFGIFDDGLEELTMDEEARWMPGSTVAPDGLRMTGDLNRGKGRALFYTCATGKTGRYEIAGQFKGLALGKPFAQAWNAENGVSLAVDGKMVFDTSPLDFGMIWVQGADQPQKPRPDGAILGLSFDAGSEADFGGGIAPVSFEAGKGKPQFLPGKSGTALAVTRDDSPLGYPVVPSWACGSVEFDLQVKAPDTQPLQLLALRHHLETTLSCAKSAEGGLELTLTAMDAPFTENASYPMNDPQDLKRAKRTLSATLPAGKPEAWRHIVLTWRSGQYALYADGTLLGKLTGPVVPAGRDREPLAAGVVVGDGRGGDKAQALVDSLLVYDWTLRPEDAAAARKPLQAAPLVPPGDAFPVYLFGGSLKDLVVSVPYTTVKQWRGVDTVKITITDAANPKKVFCDSTYMPWQGTLTVHPELTTTAVEATIDPDNPGGEGVLDEQQGDLLLRIEIAPGKAGPLAVKTIPLKADRQTFTGEY